MDGNYITTMRTAALAVYTAMKITRGFNTVSMVGLGNIGTILAQLFFDLNRDRDILVKLYRYKKQEELLANRFKNYENIQFEFCDTYKELMKDSDLIFSSVSYIERDFEKPDIYKKGVTIIPVHMRGFLECDRVFEHIVTSDLESIKKFEYYDEFKHLIALTDVLSDNPVKKEDRVIVYNLGLALTDIFYAHKIYSLLENESVEIDLSERKKLYV